MKYCPNLDCTFLATNGEAAEYRDEVTTCIDCGESLVEELSAADKSTEVAPEPCGKLTTIAQYNSVMEADIVKGKLEQAGIQSFVADLHFGILYYPIASAMGAIRLQVMDADVEDALLLIR